MALKLRTRLFVVVAVLLAASIGVAALLSRRATLVEVRALVEKPIIAPPAADALDRAAEALARTRDTDLGSALATIAGQASRRLVVADHTGRLLAASDPSLARAQVRQLSADGTFVAELSEGGATSVVHVRGAPARQVALADGRQLLVLALPPLETGESRPANSGALLWVWTTVATAVIAVPLVVAVARRILDPVTALTTAARRMQSGELDVRVDTRGGDELADLARAFNEMASRLAETERLRKRMVSDIAHELRSPVTNLRCSLEAIQDGLASPDRTSIDALHAETRLLERMIDDLQDLALADAGQLAMRQEPVDVGDVLKRAAAAVGRPSSDVSIQLDVPESLPVVTGDADRLTQVFRNLLANALTHSTSGGRIDVRAREESGAVRVDVIDDGRGIEPAHLPHLFDRFYRADRSRSRSTGGAGLGLAIVRQLVVAHGGRVEAHSDGADCGARFSVVLPAAS